MRPKSKVRTHHGFSMLEFAVAIAIIGACVGVLLQRMLYLQEYAEKTAMDLTVANMRTGLRYRTGDLLMRDKVSEIATLADENPVTWLQTSPENYLGEFDQQPGKDLRGNWYFDKTRRELVYTVNNRRHFLPARDQDYALRWHTVLAQAKEQGDSGSKGSPRWVVLAPIAGGRWF